MGRGNAGLNIKSFDDIVFNTNISGSQTSTFSFKDNTTEVALLDGSGNFSIGNDLSLATDSSIIKMGVGDDFTITHDGTTGATIAANPITIDSAGALSLFGTSINIGTDTDVAIDINSSTLDIDTSAAITIDSVGLSIDSTGVAANITSTTDGAAEDFTIALAGATDSSLILSSTGTGADALQITTTAGGIDISATGNAAGEDIDISSAASVNVTATENAANAIYLRANGGTSETIKIHSDQGTGAGSIELLSDVGGITLTGDTDHGIILGTGVSGAPISIGHTTSETTVNDNLSVTGDLAVDGTANLDNTDIDGTLVVDGSNISLDSTTTLNIDNSNTSNGITIGTATSGVPISVGHTTSETTVNDNLTVTGTTTFSSAQVGQRLTKRSITTTNETLTAAESGKLCLFSSTDGATAVLPDSGDGSLVGVYYDFYVADQLTSGYYNIKCTDTTNEAIIGFLHFCDIDTNPAVSEYIWRALASDSYDQIAMNGTTTGTVGTFFRITNIAADKWMVNGSLMATGTPATPFVAN